MLYFSCSDCCISFAAVEIPKIIHALRLHLFMKFEEKGYIKSDDKSVKSIWSSAMQIMGEVLGIWWTPWNKVTGEDIESPLPNDENLQDLADRLKNAVEDLTQQLAMPTTKMEQRTRMPWRSGGKR